MSLLVGKIGYEQAIRAIREVVLDTNPVQSFKVSGQDFLFAKTTESIVLESDTYELNEIPKLYDLLSLLREKELSIEILPEYVATDGVAGIKDFSAPSLSTPYTVKMKNYFSVGAIEETIRNFYERYLSYSEQPQTVAASYNQLDYFSQRRMVFWVAYYLIDRRRMQAAATAEMIRLQGGEDGCESGGDLKNTTSTTTMKIGDTFSTTESIDEGGMGLTGFTSLWGDKYSYLTKMQLWIRDQYERQFNDYSLRDDAARSTTVVLEKRWQGSAWIDSLTLDNYTRNILQPDR